MNNSFLNDKVLFSLCVETANGVIKTENPEVAAISDTEIRSRFFQLLGVKDTKDKAFAMRFSLHQKEVCALIVETLQEIMPDFYNSLFMQKFVDFRTYGFGEKPVFEIDDMNLFVVSRVAKGTWDTRRQKAYGKTDMVLDYEAYDIYVYADLFDFLSGRTDFAKLIAKVNRSVQFHKQQRILAEFLSLPDMVNPEFLESGSPTTQTVMELCERVGTLTGSTPVICGTKLALYNILDDIKDHWMSDTMKDEINKTGELATWKGYPVLPLPTAVIPGTTRIQPNTGKILILPGFAAQSGNNSKFIKVATMGSPLIRQTDSVQQTQDMTQEYQLQYYMGAGIAVNHYFGVCDFA
jgi:hypothetical protein